MKIPRPAYLLLAVMAPLLLGARCAGGMEPPYEAPAWVLEAAAPKMAEGSAATSSAKVDIYYDNTQSMHGFGAQGGNVVRVVTALRDMANQYTNASIFTLEPTNGTTALQWTPYSGDLRQSMAEQSFYTYGETFEQGTGPLQMLYYAGNILDPAAINVVVTDLAEQNVDSSDLAARINAEVLSQDGYSAALIGIQGEFHGRKQFSDLDQVNVMDGVQVDGYVPLYILITGPDADLDAFLGNLSKQFSAYELVDGADYVIARYHAGNSARVLSMADVFTVDPAKEQDGMRRDDWGTAVINQNLSLEEIDAAHLDTVIKTDSYLNIFTYQEDSRVNEVNTHRILLNYFLPVNRTDELGLPVHYKIYETDETAPTTDLQALYEGKDRIQYAELLVDRDAESRAEFLQDYPLATDAFEVTDDEGRVECVYGWQSPRQISRDKDLTIRYEWIDQGTPIYDMVLEADGRDPLDLYPGQDLGFAAQSDLLHISIEFSEKPEERAGDTIFLRIPVYAMAESVENIPAWIEDWDTAGTQDHVYHTFGLENFFRTLFGLNVTGDQEYDRALREVKIADIITCVTGLPTAR